MGSPIKDNEEDDDLWNLKISNPWPASFVRISYMTEMLVAWMTIVVEGVDSACITFEEGVYENRGAICRELWFCLGREWFEFETRGMKGGK